MHDRIIAKRYLSKAQSSETRGIQFDLSFMSFKNTQTAKKCYYTGLELTNTTRTIDRIDRTKGYIKGNCVACHTSINSIKAVLENPTVHGVTHEQLLKLINKWSKKV